MENRIVPKFSADEVRRNIALNIRQAAKVKYLSQKELAKMCGITECTLSRYMNGKFTPKIEILMSISLALDVTLDWLAFHDKNYY